jgi:antitoxin PrlF
MKNVAISTITSKSQTVIPRPVREKLGLRPGDRLRYVETVQGIVIEKARIVEDDPFATFAEWSSDADERAYADL